MQRGKASTKNLDPVIRHFVTSRFVPYVSNWAAEDLK